jgi:hypothetical protein
MSNKNKLNVNKDARASNGIAYLSGRFVVEDEIVGRRIGDALYITARSTNESPGVKLTVDILYSERFVQYDVDFIEPIKFDEKAGTAEFTTHGTQYKIRAVQDSDKSWLGTDEPVKNTEESKEQ